MTEQKLVKPTCCYCGEENAEISFTDEETLREIHICKKCDYLVSMVESTQHTEDF